MAGKMAVASGFLFWRSSRQFLAISRPVQLLCTNPFSSGNDAVPKRPATLFARFVSENFHQVKVANQGLRTPDLMKLTAEMYRNLPQATKNDIARDYHEELLEFKEKMAALSPEQLAQYKQQMIQRKKKRASIRKSRLLVRLSKPKRPANSFALYVSENAITKTGMAKDIIRQLAADWKNMTENEKMPYHDLAEARREEAESNLRKWEEKMLLEGHHELVRRKYTPQHLLPRKKEKAPKKKAKKVSKKKTKKVAKKRATKKKATKTDKATLKKPRKEKVDNDSGWMREE